MFIESNNERTPGTVIDLKSEINLSSLRKDAELSNTLY